MRSSAGLILIVASLNASLASAACEMPTPVASIPDGATATEAQLLAVQGEVQAYVAAMDRFIACQNEEMAVGGDGSMQQYLYLMARRIEAARTEVDLVATRFNDQVMAFRAARQAERGFR